MKQGLEIFIIDSNFQEQIQALTQQYYIKKWELLPNKSITGLPMILIEYRDTFPEDQT